MISFYKDKEKGILNPALFSDEAEKLAERIHKSGSKNANKRTQLRKFYDEVIRLSSMVKNEKKPEDWNNILPYVHMLIAKAAYAEGRNHVTKEFTEFLKASIKQVKKQEDLIVFANFFEAFMGFYRKYGA